jgi:hypothetical protein
MKNKLLFAGMAAASLITAAVQAAPAVLGDSDLDAISGKNNTAGSASATIGISAQYTGSDASANIQVGFYQWFDNHGSDGSTVKGGNQVDGTSLTVQSGSSALNNAFFWGGLGQNNLAVTSGIGASSSNMAYGTFANGGF